MKQIYAENQGLTLCIKIICIKISRQGIMPLPDKVQAIKHIAVPTNKKQLTSFIGC